MSMHLVSIQRSRATRHLHSLLMTEMRAWMWTTARNRRRRYCCLVGGESVRRLRMLVEDLPGS